MYFFFCSFDLVYVHSIRFIRILEVISILEMVEHKPSHFGNFDILINHLLIILSLTNNTVTLLVSSIKWKKQREKYLPLARPDRIVWMTDDNQNNFKYYCIWIILLVSWIMISAVNALYFAYSEIHILRYQHHHLNDCNAIYIYIVDEIFIEILTFHNTLSEGKVWGLPPAYKFLGMV